MTVFCCCTSSRSSKTRPSAPKKSETVLPSPPPPARLSGPLSLNPVIPVSAETSPRSLSSLQPSVPANISPMEAIELGQLVVEDSDTEDEPDPAPHNKSSSTLQLVRTRIRRHLSQDELSRRKARSAVGCSEEEIQRRAELKRLMHKRIQEELRSEESPQESSPSEVSSGHRRPLPVLEHLPGGGPRDNIEFSVSEDGKPETPSMESPESGIQTSRSRPNSSNDHRAVRERSSLPQMPSSPDLVPRRYPSTRDTSSLGSWRLSYSADQLDELLGYADQGDITKEADTNRHSPASPELIAQNTASQEVHLPSHAHSLSRSHSSPARHGPHDNESPSSVTEQSPLSVWLRSQGLQSRSPSPTRFSDQEFESGTSVQEAEVVYLRRWSSVQNCAVPEAEMQRPEVVHLYDMDIHGQLATRAFNTPLESPNRSQSGRNSRVTYSGDQQNSESSVPPPSDPSSNKSAGIYKEAVLVSQDPNGMTATTSSSMYPSTGGSVYPSAGTSNLHLPGTLANHKLPAVFSLPGHKWLDTHNPYLASDSEKTSQQPTGENSRHGSMTPVTMASRVHVTSPAPSSAVTEKYRGVSDMGHVEKSIGYFHLGSGAPALIVKRFSRGADTPPPEPPKQSLLARLHLTLPRKSKSPPRTFDGPAPNIEVAPQLESEPGSPSPRKLSSVKNPRPHSWGSGTNFNSFYHPLTPILSEYEGSVDDLWRTALSDDSQRRLSGGRQHETHRRGSSFPESLSKRLQDATMLSEHDGAFSGYTGRPSTERLSPLSSTPVSPLSRSTDCGLSSIAETTETPKDSPSTRQQSPLGHHKCSSTSVPGRNLVTLPMSPSVGHKPAPRRSGYQSREIHCTVPTALGVSTETDETAMPSTASDQGHRTVRSTPSFHGKVGRAFKSRFSRLVPSRGSLSGTEAKQAERQPKTSDEVRRSTGTAGPHAATINPVACGPITGGGHVSAVHLGRTGRMRTKIPLSTRMATLLHTDGGSEPSPLPRSTTIHYLATPEPAVGSPGHKQESTTTTTTTTMTTTTTERFVTPLSSFRNSNDTSYHSCPQSRPHTDIDSVKSDSTPIYQTYSTTTHTTPTDAARFQTWSGRSRTHPLLAVQRAERTRKLDKKSTPRSSEMKAI
ncbi:hypothetical protein QBC35DRAFT_379450 [Podospora australis]|uniref:Uncharacterized protein n=1 Tax=Podospora australis TaxID=1536484 RepID=A0AAN7AJU7_9PEZI|nr:hypothetical protein QBC35DRAFT_379450 [Podospora australis]